MKSSQVEHISIKKINDNILESTDDQVAVEEPLEIKLEYSSTTGRIQKNIAVTMRTPGNDAELAVGFLFTEGIIENNNSIKEIKTFSSDENRILIRLQENILPVLHNAERNFYSTSSCGICGKASIDAIRLSSIYAKENEAVFIDVNVLYGLQETLRKEQLLFEHTGGIHASALFTVDGNFIMIKEDVGRHNAFDKLIGAAFLNQQLPLNNCILLLSGRASFELLQKAYMAGISIVAAVGAPSSLAVEMAKDAGITLIGFLRDGRFNLYSGDQRILIK